MLQQESTKTRGKPGRPKGSPPTPASWRPGQSGNPAGAPVTERTRIANTLVRAADQHREQLAAVVIQQALQGCVASQRLVFERLGPAPVRAQTAAQPMPGIEVGSIEARLQTVLQAAAEGRVSADEAKVLIDGIRGATEAAAIANAERELQAIRAMRHQALGDAAVTHQKDLQATQVAEEVLGHVREA
jgi:hypothetical protein